mmetsp:Transcript_1510/g.4378  ORF Transcript_1510/g.4378 Transcript_1510/m.4378 type:complete len:337 (-) Transcript_1510:755-1765(-)|eukprot:CAMPEP_0117649638 /NCGR_PEP_ID=MMETSP0804-20121206/1085_1 /TAXON_ID=1074897 /ORGANISM="Tetraselmis astigmatica, Strain CCMP880" /LENGTH=336 /DNA_ID=CAMNT_0005455401 /DNA_START=107 /DNA_END=1117 /DNA_ORIENTATION=+
MNTYAHGSAVSTGRPAPVMAMAAATLPHGIRHPPAPKLGRTANTRSPRQPAHLPTARLNTPSGVPAAGEHLGGLKGRLAGSGPTGRRGVTVRAAAAGEIVREVLSPEERRKLDEGEDRQFYDYPRIVKHVDDAFLAQVTRLYRQSIPEGGVVLDLMSSWVSHLPGDVSYERVIGHGMNAAELGRNKSLDSFFVRDLNQNPTGWALEDQSVDAVVCCVSVQYMQYPEKVFSEIYRVLKPGGVCIMTFSNRLFYGKAISAWRDGTGYSRSRLVVQYFQSVAGFTPAAVLTEVPETAKDLQANAGPLGKIKRLYEFAVSRLQGDPLYAVISYRDFKPNN